jgi:hypothetical protein
VFHSVSDHGTKKSYILFKDDSATRIQEIITKAYSLRSILVVADLVLSQRQLIWNGGSRIEIYVYALYFYGQKVKHKLFNELLKQTPSGPY